MITSFSGPYAFLSNFYRAPFTMPTDGLTYATVEHFYQAHKTLDRALQFQIRIATTPGKAKRLGRKVPLRSDWAFVKLSIMSMAIHLKFTQHPTLHILLKSTSPQTLIEGNQWHDNYWGNCLCPKCKNIPGQNHLGTILMKFREHQY